jgi:hypothetical protein
MPHNWILRPRSFVSILTITVAALMPRPSVADVPADGWVVWTSLRDQGRAETFRCRADGSEVTQLTKTGGTYPIWSPDGRWIAYRDNADKTHLMRPDGSNDRLIGGWHLFWMHDNAGLAMLEGDDGYVLDPDTGDRTPLFKQSEFSEFANTLTHFYAMTHDRRYMFMGSGLYEFGFTGANGTYKQGYSAVLVDMLDKRKIYMVHLGCWPFTPPAGDFVYHIRGDGPTWPDIYRLNLTDVVTLSSYQPEVSFPDPDWGHEYHPQISNDNQWMVYMASQGCHWDYNCNNEIFIHRLGTGSTSRTQVTNHEAFDAFPSIYIGTPWTATDPARLVLSPNKITFFARKTVVPASRTVLAKSSADGNPGVGSVTATTSASWLQTQVEGNKITVGLRPGQVWRGRCAATIQVTAPGLLGSPGEIQVTMDGDETFPEPPLTSSNDAGASDAEIELDGDIQTDSSDGPCDVPAAGDDGGPTTTPPMNGSGGCGCSVGGPTRGMGAFVLLLAAACVLRPRRTGRTP